MKKRYTRKQITEAIAYWQKQLKAKQYICESRVDIESLKARLRNAAQDEVADKQMPEDIEDICRDIVENFVYNHSEQMLMKFADGYKDKDYIKNIEGEMSTQKAYDSQFAQYEHSDATSLYTECNGNIDQLKNNVEIVTATVDEDDYDMKSVTVEFKYNGKTYSGFDVWYSGNMSNDDQEEFQHCHKSEFDDIIYWIDNNDNENFIELPADALQCIKGKYISKSDLLDILDYMLDNDDVEYVKIT